MHEFALYGQVPKEIHHRTLQQLAGYTRMQPIDASEIHLVFQARQPSGLDKIPSAGGSQGVLQPDVQRWKNMLNASLYYVQLVGEVATPISSSPESKPTDGTGDVTMTNGGGPDLNSLINWTLEFRDTPDPGKQAVSTRLISRTPLDEGSLMTFMDHFGYEYVSRYMLTGFKFYDNDTTLYLHKVLTLPQGSVESAMTDFSFLSNISELGDLDGSGGALLQASIDVVDGNNPELKDRATRQLLALKEGFKQGVDLTPGDRLALDTRLPAVNRRI
ncbi:uncharacterized protein A1O9_11295 [Exophiala aquamarina CBS 119918]|uniref:Mediator of RNA polymerase II transcription subunit 18 n=1 Tax=Exophiala aquamarina CBS 119918 TaxID=1182545 RepID=A0A072NZN1_9EURO|nr:uncharacterized protein A1O9_11295 [Exophiala aquamarina CBS 119918]KEF52877.1 hypothetical protein A1O9_11295 [Exophiala aquamarina CBS 119918]